MLITNSVKYVGVNDRNLDLFEGQYIIPNGISYNSYVILDEKIAVLDTVDAFFTDEWLNNIENVLGKKTPDYLIIQHMEPDHSANIKNFINKYPNAKIVSSSKSFVMMKNFFGDDFINNQLVVGEGSTLSLGSRTLTFITAPMVHWPEVIVTYDDKDKILFSADGFGKFGCPDADEEWACEARRYYFGIVGKYGAQVQSLLKKASSLDINIICPLHGPVLNENLSYYLNLYDIWSSYKSESEGVVIAYTSVYGNTRKAVLKLKELLEERGCKKVVINDLARCDMAEAVEDAFRFNKIVLATTTYNGEIFPFMREFIHELTERNFQNKRVGFIENGTWAPVAAKYMAKMLENSKNMVYT
ncbi:MAG: FprA family A-type flavoprotein, partial [Clostridia bacterium]|nr:FprA family A-type flavoprotein [Clostridia bacterium]